MKFGLTLIAMMLVFSVGEVFAAPGGGMQSSQDMMSTQHSTQQMSHQMMSQDHMRNMTKFMKQMQSSVNEMTKLMQKHKMMNQIQLGEASKVMQQMSTQMHEMSQKMAAGTFDDKELAMLRQHHQAMLKDMKKLQQTLQQNK